MSTTEQRTYPGAVGPDRESEVDAWGARISVKEWGAATDPPLLLGHGGFDFARTFDVFAPLLARAGWRVVAWDQRGHGDSEHSELYSWEADVRDAAAVLDSIGPEPIPFVGHSKGGSLLLRLATTWPHRVSRLVNMDGLPFLRIPDIAEHERTRMLAEEMRGWLDHRRRTAARVRRPDTIAGLAARRARMNPRLDRAWLEYLVTVGGRHDTDGWRWKLDPTLRFGGFGPWRPEWALGVLPSLPVPLLGILATEQEVMGWGTRARDLEPYAAPDMQIVELEGVGHFVHIEQPDEVAQLVLAFVEEVRP